MKPLQILACAAALLLPMAGNAAPSELQQFLTEGQTAFMKGDLTTAKTDFDWVLKLDPHNRTAIGYMHMIEAQEAQKSKGIELEKQLAALIVPKLEFKDATLGSALDYMKKAADKLSGGKVAVSFVVQLPAEQANTQTVTLSLANIPYTEALRYIGGLAGLSFTYEKYAVVVRPAKDAASAANATSPPNPGGAPGVVPTPK